MNNLRKSISVSVMTVTKCNNNQGKFFSLSLSFHLLLFLISYITTMSHNSFIHLHVMVRICAWSNNSYAYATAQKSAIIQIGSNSMSALNILCMCVCVWWVYLVATTNRYQSHIQCGYASNHFQITCSSLLSIHWKNGRSDVCINWFLPPFRQFFLRRIFFNVAVRCVVHPHLNNDELKLCRTTEWRDPATP